MATMAIRPEEITMGKDNFQFARIASPEEIAEYLTSLAVGLKRGEVSLESGERALHLSPPSDVKLQLKVREKEHKGRVEIEIGWKRSMAARTTELRVMVGPRASRA
jgi:amphi-Trp domain-containing protein